MCVGFCLSCSLQNSEKPGEGESMDSTLPGAPCPGKYLGCRRRLLVCVSNQSYSALNDRVEPPGIFHSSLGLAGLKPVILLPANSCC